MSVVSPCSFDGCGVYDLGTKHVYLESKIFQETVCMWRMCRSTPLGYQKSTINNYLKKNQREENSVNSTTSANPNRFLETQVEGVQSRGPGPEPRGRSTLGVASEHFFAAALAASMLVLPPPFFPGILLSGKPPETGSTAGFEKKDG